MKMESQELFDRVRAMEEKEMVLVVKAMPDKVLIDEYVRRHEKLSEMVNGARRSLMMEKGGQDVKAERSDGCKGSESSDKDGMGFADIVKGNGENGLFPDEGGKV